MCLLNIFLDHLKKLIMKHVTKDGVLLVLTWLFTIASAVGLAIITWQWINPINFIGIVAFLVCCAVFTRLVHWGALAISARISRI